MERQHDADDRKVSRRTMLAASGAAAAGGALFAGGVSPAAAAIDGFNGVAEFEVPIYELVSGTPVERDAFDVQKVRVTRSGSMAALNLRCRVDDPSELGTGPLCLKGSDLIAPGPTSYEPLMPEDDIDTTGQAGWGGTGFISDPQQAPTTPPDPSELTYYTLVCGWSNFTAASITTPLLLFTFSPANGRFGLNVVSKVQPFPSGLNVGTRLWITGLLYELAPEGT
jgi:hypothetical protein